MTWRDDQDEVRSLFERHILPMAAHGAKRSELGRAWLDLLHEADRVGRDWAKERLDRFALDGAGSDAMDMVKRLSRASYRRPDGSVGSLAAVRGVTKRDEAGASFQQQTLLNIMSYDEFVEHVLMMERQHETLGDRLPKLRQLQRIYDAHRLAPTLDAACALAGTSVEEVLLDGEAEAS